MTIKLIYLFKNGDHNTKFFNDTSELVDFLKENTHITSLDLSNSDLGQGDVEALTSVLKELKNLTSFYLDGNDPKKEGGQIDLSGNVLREEGTQALAPAFKFKALKNLTPLDSSEDNPESFTPLDSSKDNPEKKGVQALAPAFKFKALKNLTPLDSSENNYEKEGAQALAKVPENKSTKVDGADVTKHTGEKQQAVSQS